MDRTIHTPEEVKRFTGQSPMSIVPFIDSIEPKRFGLSKPVRALPAPNRKPGLRFSEPLVAASRSCAQPKILDPTGEGETIELSHPDRLVHCR